MAEKKEQAAAAPAATDKASAAPPGKYVAVTGITYPEGVDNVKRAKAGQLDKVTKWTRVEPGDDASDIPAEDLPWMLREGFIKKVT